jgi:hypothetical protein
MVAASFRTALRPTAEKCSSSRVLFPGLNRVLKKSTGVKVRIPQGQSPIDPIGVIARAEALAYLEPDFFSGL